MERLINIKTKDNHLIYATLNMPNKKSDKVVVFVHGLTGHQNEHLFYNAAKFFPANGFTTFRFDLYSGEKQGRCLRDCTIKIHAHDLERVIDYLKKKFKKIFLVGHSLGGMVIFEANTNVISAITLWDPTHADYNLADDIIYNKANNFYILNWGIEYIIGGKMHREFTELPPPKQCMKNISQPVKVISAGKGIMVNGGREYFKYASEPKEFAIIKNGGHCFNQEGVETELFKETLNWFKKF